MYICEDGISAGFNPAKINKVKKDLHILQQNQNLQSWQIQDEFVLINLIIFELGDHRMLPHTLDLTPTSTYIWR